MSAALTVMPETNRLGLTNRLGKGGERYLNSRKTRIKDALATTAGVGASIVTATAVRNSSIMQEGIKKIGQFIKSSKVGKTLEAMAKEVMPYIQKGITWFKALPAPAKAVLVAGLALTALISKSIRNKGLREDGKIEQKYDDRAALKAALTEA